MSYRSVMERVERSIDAAAGWRDQVTVVAVSKGRSVGEIRALYDLGHRDFGENRAQELVAKVPECPDDIRWHFVGPLQSNKVRLVRPVAHLLHSMDRVDLGRVWMKGPGRPPSALLQVNIGREPQKSGVDPDDVDGTIRQLGALGVNLVGLMAIPPVAEDPALVRPYFDHLRALRDRLSSAHPALQELSMGMSDDFEVAIAAGSTIIRVGRAIFGD